MKFVALNSIDHRDLRFTPNQSYSPLRQQMLVPLAASECARMAREGTLVKPSEQPQMCLLAGLDLGQCQYINDTGHWLGRTPPAMFRLYPFRLADLGEQNYQVQIDLQAPHWSADGGEPLFTPDGEHAPLMEKVRTALTRVQQDLMKTQQLTQQLDEAGLWMTQNLIYGKGGAKSAVTGLQIIDVQKLGALPAETLLKLHRSGALALAFAQANSLSNLRDGVLAQAVGRNPGNDPFDALDLDGIDWGRLQ